MMQQRSVSLHHDGDDVKTYATVRHAVLRRRQPLHGGMAQIDLLGSGHRLLRGAVAHRTSGFDLDENDLAHRIARHDVEFAVSAMPVAVERPPPLAFQPCGGVLFSQLADLSGTQRAVMQTPR